MEVHQARRVRVRLPHSRSLRKRHVRQGHREVTRRAEEQRRQPMRQLNRVIITALMLAALAYPASAQEVTDGQVTKIDEPAGKITLKHGPIKKFDMDEGMTMVFKAQDPAMLKSVKVGDKVKFEAERVNGQFTVTKIQKTK